MYINPETKIRILKDVPLDTTYEHTIWFDTKIAQYNYFSSLTKHYIDNSTYQRVNKGVARIGIKSDLLYDCNYMMFQNSSFGDKWFYAYITKVEYINNVTSEITFEIDVMQTWFFEHSPDYCFVEREHAVTDAIGEHIEPEGVDCGEYVYNFYEPVENFSDMMVVIAIVDTEGETVSGKLYDGVYGGCTLWAYRVDQVSQINSKIEEYLQKPDAIQTIYMCPQAFLPSSGQVGSGSTAPSIDKSYPAITKASTLDGYTPKNAKLYTYPYNFLCVDNASSGSIALRYEFFDGLSPKLRIFGTITQPIQSVCYPLNYKNTGSGGGSNTLHTESLQVNSFPMCSWNTDAYKAWVAQNTIPAIANVGGGIAQGAGMGVITGNIQGTVAGIVGGLVQQAASLIGKTYTASIQADLAKGTANNGGVNSASGRNGFYAGRVSITHQYAKCIDDFFTKFGYGVRALKIPNRSARPHWNFVKTVGATLTGSVPADDMKKLCEIYDNGVTFWKNGSEVGNYSLDNSPVGGTA